MTREAFPEARRGAMHEAKHHRRANDDEQGKEDAAPANELCHLAEIRRVLSRRWQSQGRASEEGPNGRRASIPHGGSHVEEKDRCRRSSRRVTARNQSQLTR